MVTINLLGVLLVCTLVHAYSFSLKPNAIGGRCQLSQRKRETGTRRPTGVHLSTSPSEDALIIDQAIDSALGFLQNAEVSTPSSSHSSSPGYRAKSPRFTGDDFDMFEIYSDSPEFVVPHELIAELEEREAKALANKVPSSADLNAEHINSAVLRWRKHDTDVGSAEVQVAIADEKIKYLTKHLLANRKDLSAKRGLQAMVVTRRKFLDYLSRTDADKARLMVQELGIRFRSSGNQWDKLAKYGAFTNTKAKYVKGTDGKKRRIKK